MVRKQELIKMDNHKQLIAISLFAVLEDCELSEIEHQGIIDLFQELSEEN